MSNHHKASGGFLGGGYFLSFVGALVYFISNASGFWDGALGVLKAIVWPAFLIFNLFTFLNVS
jgi:hypothetical protein